MVHYQTNLINIQKFNYLKEYLQGEARQLIDSFAITDDNYQEVWAIQFI